MTEKTKNSQPGAGKSMNRSLVFGAAFVVVLVVAFIAIAVISANGAAETAAPAKLEGVAAEGKALFLESNCATCHPAEGRKGGIGPRLSTTGYSDESFRNIVRKGRGSMPSNTQLTDDQLNKIIAYVRALKPA